MDDKVPGTGLKSVAVLLMVFLIGSLGLYAQYELTEQRYRATASVSTAGEEGYDRGDFAVRGKEAEGDTEEKATQIIVEYHQPPISRVIKKLERDGQKGKVLQNNIQRLESRISDLHRRLRSDLDVIAGKSKQKSKISSGFSPIRYTFAHVYAGAALEVYRGLTAEIRNLPYVKEVHRDQKMNVVSDTVRNIIGVDKLLEQVSATGKEIDVAILDTGVDYLHPALGGGIGEDYKVKGGYDVVHGDSNPMDDNGHGTQVAGIIAANGKHRGIAPEASLYAYKVLQNDGTGLASSVIKGLERAVNEKVDIINMSLGGPGDSEDPLSTSVNNAVQSGVLVVVAAGNKGSDYWTVLSPASADLALTVGATYKDDRITRFSSRGPTPKKFNIKPDIVAPGSGLTTTNMNGAYGTHTGTSMAAPVVTGAAALLLELQPDDPPRLTKSKLTQSAKNLGEKVWSQGGGRVQIDKAIEQNLVSVPGHVSFGLVPNEPDRWSHTDTVTFYNLSAGAGDYNLTVEGDNPAGIEVRTESSQLSISAYDSAKIAVTVTVDNERASYPPEQPLDYSGSLRAVNNSDTLSIPWGVIKTPHLTVSTQYDGTIDIYAHKTNETGHSKQKHIKSFGKKEQIHWRFLVNESYNIIAEFRRRFNRSIYNLVVRENVDIASTDSLRIKPDEAIHTIELQPVDEQGREFSSYRQKSTKIYLEHQTGFSVQSAIVDNSFNVSDVSSNYWLKGYKTYRVPKQDEVYHDYVTTSFRFHGLQENKVVTDDPSEYREVSYIFGRDSVHHYGNKVDARIGNNQFPSESISAGFVTVLPNSPKKYVLHMLPDSFTPTYKVVDLTLNRFIYETARHRPGSRDSIIFERDGYEYTWHTKDIGDIQMGHVLPFFSAGINNDMIWTGRDRGFFHDAFGALLAKSGSPTNDLMVKLHRNGSVVQEEELSRTSLIRKSVNLQQPSEGDWLEVRFRDKKYAIDDTLGALEARYYFGGSNSGTAPKISDLRLTSGNTPTNKLSFREENQLKLSLNSNYRAVSERMDVYNNINSIQVYIRPSGDERRWRLLDENTGQSSIKSSIGGLKTGYYDLMISISDGQGNRLEYEAAPAFKFIGPKRRLAISSSDHVKEARFPIAINVLDSLGYDDINQYDFSFSYDDSLLSFQGLELEGTLSEGATYQVRKDTAGLIHVRIESSEPIRGVGELMRMMFKTRQKNGVSSLDINEFTFNQEDLKVVISPGKIEVLPAMLGDVSNNGEISAYDASQILYYINEKIDLTSTEKMAANVGRSEWVTSRDAILVLRKVVGHITEFPERDLEHSVASVDHDKKVAGDDTSGEGPVYIGNPVRKELDDNELIIEAPLHVRNREKVQSVRTILQFQSDKIDVRDISFPNEENWFHQYRFDQRNKKLNLALAGSQTLPEKKFAVLEIVIEGEVQSVADLKVTGTSRVNEEAGGKISETTLVDIPERVELKPNFPNPFNPTTTIQYGIPTDTHVRLDVYDIQGRRVANLVDGSRRAGMHEVTFRADNLASGVYVYTLRAHGEMRSKKLMLVK